ncbi:MazG nucleotide pyrophosphohydrolase domain-containing protein [Nocardioides sp.]|uniref:MazG nucleotide pyrophosphohydrolase domain-containing protein n=1 Tax=Nocardioides sp. TaxID=35761 RepID=UPI002B26B220|nr:MazG nucleotide pyrophosphohydrolase domain-containing protein [Nocardioides sp.]
MSDPQQDAQQEAQQDPQQDPLHELVAVMRRLRSECAWKAEQTPQSLVPYLREETEELVEAIGSGDTAHVCEELGDVLLQVVFHAAIAEERGDFDLDDVAAGITAKLRRRNPHVFDPASLGRDASSPALTAVVVNEIWQQVKATEKGAG